MQPKKSAIGKMDRRPIFYNESYTVDAGGGTTGTITEQWQAWAEIKDRSGSTSLAQATELTQYNYDVTVRFDGRFTSQTTMVYEGQVCKCESLSIKSEGYKEFLSLRFSKTDTWVDLS